MYRYRMDRLPVLYLIIRIVMTTFIFCLLFLLISLIIKILPTSYLGSLGYLWVALAWLLISTLWSLAVWGSETDGYTFKGKEFTCYYGKRREKTLNYNDIDSVTLVYGINSLFGYYSVLVEAGKESVTVRLKKDKAKIFYKWIADTLDDPKKQGFDDSLLDLYRTQIGGSDITQF